VHFLKVHFLKPLLPQLNVEFVYNRLFRIAVAEFGGIYSAIQQKVAHVQNGHNSA
jgi:hypothetical protein